MTPARLMELDALRSFALGGILVVNIWYFADPFTLAGAVSPDHSSAGDLAVRFVVAALFEAKFYILFSFLFGYSFVLQWQATDSAGTSVTSRVVRRLGCLLVLGLLHGLLLFFGDILLTYALMGFLLLATRSARPAASVVTGSAIIVVIGSVMLLIGVVVALSATGLPELTLDPTATTASPAAAFEANASNFLGNVAGVIFLQGPLSLAMFYLGMAAAKVRLLEKRPSTKLLTTTAATCLPLGVTAGVAQAYLTTYVDPEQFSILALGISTLTAPLQTAGYVSALLVFFRTRTGNLVMGFLAPAGRLALTNYLAQSVAMALIFSAYGLALANQPPAVVVLVTAVVIFTAQLALSRLYLSRFRQGPVEALLRRVTYGSPTAARRSSAG